MVKKEIKALTLEEQFKNNKRDGALKSLKPYFKFLNLSAASKHFEGSSKAYLIASTAALEGIYEGDEPLFSEDFKKLNQGLGYGIKTLLLPSEGVMKGELLTNMLTATVISMIGLTFLAIEKAKPGEEEYPSNMDIYPELITRMYFRSDIPYTHFETVLESAGVSETQSKKGAKALEGFMLILILALFGKDSGEMVDALQAKLEVSLKAIDDLLPADFVETKAFTLKLKKAIEAKQFNTLTKEVVALSHRLGVNPDSIKRDVQNIKRLFLNLKNQMTEGLQAKTNVVTFTG